MGSAIYGAPKMAKTTPISSGYTEAFNAFSGSMWQYVAVCGSLWHDKTT